MFVPFQIVKQAGGINLGLMAIALVQLVRFLFRWGSERYDKHIERVTEREARADASIAARLRNLEANEERYEEAGRRLRGEILSLYKALSVLTRKIQELSPFDPALIEVAQILAAAVNSDQSVTPEDMVEKLHKLGGVK